MDCVQDAKKDMNKAYTTYSSSISNTVKELRSICVPICNRRGWKIHVFRQDHSWYVIDKKTERPISSSFHAMSRNDDDLRIIESIMFIPVPGMIFDSVGSLMEPIE